MRNSPPLQIPIASSRPLAIEMSRVEYDDYIKGRRLSSSDPKTGAHRETVLTGLKTPEALLEYVNQTYCLLGHIDEIIIKD